jgi:hypothetical protein
LLRLPPPAAALPAQGGSLLSSGSVLAGLGAIAVTGLLAGILVAAPRISPLAAGLPGLLLLGWTVLYLVSVHQAVRLIPLRGDEEEEGEAIQYVADLKENTGLAGSARPVPSDISGSRSVRSARLRPSHAPSPFPDR